MREILCLSHTPWQARPTRTKQLLSRLADVRVLFAQPPLRGERPEQGRRMRAHISVYTLPPAPPVGAPLLLQRHTLRRDAAFLRDAMARQHMREPVLWCTAPEQVALLDLLPCRGVVYDCAREWEEELVEQESELVRRADVSFAASPGLVERLSPCGDNIALLPNGVNPLMFSRPDLTPPDIAIVPPGRPLLARVGDLTAQVELAPLLAAAQAQPDWTFLLIGRVSRQAGEQLSRYSNIRLAGPVNPVELPDYLCACQVLFDLLRTDRRGSDVVSPRIYEYLATGKPIVTMMEPDSVEPFPDVIYTAYDGAGFLRRCRKALEETPGPAVQRRLDCARDSAWAVRSAEVARIFESTGLF